MASRIGLIAGPLLALLTWILLVTADLSMPPAASATAAVSEPQEPRCAAVWRRLFASTQP